ncbi:ABC transporter substrate-binding protein [Clostridium thermosuccinogenes]|uniref:ABC transporter substrate-binding protein n=1 Tax=Clostridium thermosuccinogenes TaxID=84032 RepID=UPI000CCC08EC|nr:ABC transporter substrate-binding protein [Pseudoclostridium thermosuccinogenes]PNT92334.1 sulfonate/nitrate/taurine transporter substrate-binding protein [Pseudoclostridium thermosuccinogenes]
MKKLLSALLILTLTAMMLAGCNTASNKAGNNKETSSTSSDEITTSEEPKEQSDEQKYEPVDIRIGGLKGPTSIGMVKLMESAEASTAANNYSFTIAGSADELTPKLIQGELDIAAVPANLASVLYNNTNKAIKLLAVNTLGVLYIVEKGSAIDSLDDLKGKTIYATGKGSVPEYNLRYLLSQNGIDPDKDVTIEWKTEPTEVVALFKETDGGIAMLPQPYVTVAQTQVEGLNIAVDLTQAWDELNNGSALITGVLVVRKEFAEKYPGQIAAFLDEYKLSTEYVNANVSEAAKLVEKFDIVKAAVAEKAIPYCNITYLEGAEMKDAMEGYLGVLFEQNPKSVGGVLPEDDFYYTR